MREAIKLGEGPLKLSADGPGDCRHTQRTWPLRDHCKQVMMIAIAETVYTVLTAE